MLYSPAIQSGPGNGLITAITLLHQNDNSTETMKNGVTVRCLLPNTSQGKLYVVLNTIALMWNFDVERS